MKAFFSASRLAVLGLIATTTLSSQALADPKIGDPAPSLSLAKWFQGKPVDSFKSGQIYVVEFWATWCGPCKQSIPHLTELSKQYGDKVVFIGVDSYEGKGGVPTNSYDKVAKFVKGMGEKMTYDVASDTPEGKMGKTWMDPYHQNGIPCAFIVDGTGHIVSVRNPLDPTFTTNLAKVVDGSFDVAKEASDFAQQQADEAKAQEQAEAFQKAITAAEPDVIKQVKAGDLTGAEQTITKAETSAGGAENIPVESILLPYIAQYNQPLFDGYLDKYAHAKLWDSSPALNDVAWTYLTDGKLKGDDYKLAVVLAKRASSLIQDKDPATLDTLALAYFKSGDKAMAIQTEQKAVDLSTAAEKAGYQKTLDGYKSGKAALPIQAS